MSENVSVLIADDHPLVRGGLRALLEASPGLEVAGEAGDGTIAVELALELQPDVVVMDLNLPGLDGIAATRQIVERSPHIAVLVLTMLDDDDSLLAALKAGARGYLLKGTEPDDVLRAVRSVARGDAIFGSDVASRVVASFGHDKTPSEVPFPELTDRERQILELLAAGQKGPAIAEQLGLAAKTIRNHVSNILTKLCALDRTEAILRAREAGLGGSGQPRR